MWIVSDEDYVEGDLHGFVEKFEGIGIIFDTFKNTEHLSYHRDVTVLINDGQKTYEIMTEDILGCNTNLRYSSERADFSVTDSARVKISLDNGKLMLQIDSRNTGDWMPCVDIDDIRFRSGWIRESHIGFTGSTGQLADNHDIISFHTFTDAIALNSWGGDEMRKDFELKNDSFNDETISIIENAINKLIFQQNYMDHHFEHELVSVEDHLKNMQAKLGKQSEVDERLSEIEQKIRSNNLEEIFKENLKGLESQLQLSIDRKVQSLHAEINAVTELFNRAEGNSLSW